MFQDLRAGQGAVLDDVADYFNRYYHLYNAENSNLTEIQWSSVNYDGRVKDAAYFGHENWNCWATNLMDVVCP